MFGRRWVVAGLVALGSISVVPVVGVAAAGAAVPIPGAFTPLGQTQLLDTHTGVGATRARIASHASLNLQVLGRGGVPTTGVEAVRINVTAFDTTGAGSVLVAGEGVVTFTKGQSMTNGIVVRPGRSGRVTITNSSTGLVDVSVVAFGYYTGGKVTQSGMLVPSGFAHLVSTAAGLGAPKRLLASKRTLTIAVNGHASVPSGGASAVVLALSGFGATASGAAVAFEGDLPAPGTPSLIYRSGETSRSLVTVPVAPNGTIKIYNRGPGALNISADVEGYYRMGAPLARGAYVSREAIATRDSALTVGAGQTVTTNPDSYFVDPSDATYQVGLYVASPSEAGSLSVWMNGASRPSLPSVVFGAGSARFVELPLRAANYTIALHNYSHASIRVMVVERGLYSNGQLGAITGTVTDSSGHPIAGVRVGVADDPSAAQDAATSPDFVTGPDGRYQVGGITPGTYAVCFNPERVSPTLSVTGFQARCYNQENYVPDDVTVSAGQTLTAIDAALPTGASLAGHVTDTNAKPLAGITVQASASSLPWVPGSVKTASDGSFRINGLDPSQSYNTCSLTGLSTSPASAPAGYLGACTQTSPQPVADAVTDTGTISMGLAVGVSGTVTDTSGHPLAHVGVGVGEAFSGYVSPSTTTDSRGHYVVTGINNGAPYPQHIYVCFETHYWPTAPAVTGGTSTTGYVDQCYKNTVPNAQTSAPNSTPIDPALGAVAPNINGRLLPAAAVTGTVRNSAGHPLKGIEVVVQTQDLTRTTGFQSTTTSATGTYRIAGLQPGAYAVCFFPTPGDPWPPPSGYLSQCWSHVDPAHATENVNLSYGQTASHIDGSLNAGGSISGTVTDSTGHPVQGANVRVDNQARATTGADGRYTIAYIQPGSHSVCFDASSATGGTSTTGYQNQCWNNQPFGASSSTQISVTVGHATTGVDAALAGAGGISVHVTDSSGNPLTGAPVDVYVGDQTSNGVQYGATGSDGSYTVGKLSDGQYTVCIGDTSGVTGGTSTTGYQQQCFGQTNSVHSTPVTVAGDTVPITIVLPAN